MVCASRALCGVWLLAGCAQPPQAEPPAQPAEPARSKTPELRAAPAPAPAAMPPVATLHQALRELQDHVRPAAGRADNPWALAHGMLAFGRDFKTTEGTPAVAAIMKFATPSPPAPGDGGGARYRFPREAEDGTPIDPHPHALALALRRAGVPLDTPYPAADGKRITVGRVLTDLREAPDPASVPTAAQGQDGKWHSVAWRLAALALDPAAAGPELDALRALSLQRLQLDMRPFVGARAAGAFAPRAPMGAAKRARSHLYGHSCGGLHFLDAVVRSHPANGEPTAAAQLDAALDTLHVRNEAEQSLYDSLYRDNPKMRVELAVQALKFSGHLLEVLASAHAMGYRAAGRPAAAKLDALEAQVAHALLKALARLRELQAYAHLNEQPHQVQLDLIGDGCHAVAALTDLLRRLESPAR